MQQSVLDIFPAFTTKLEGAINWMYLDKRGLVTVGWGYLIDPLGPQVLRLPWVVRGAGTDASPSDVTDNWHAVKKDTSLAVRGAQAAKQYAYVGLTDEGMQSTAFERLRDDEEYVLNHWFPDFDAWPADAQLALLSMCWAMGPDGFKKFPKFAQACREQAWQLAALECYMNSTNNPGLIPRNKANRKLFEAAAAIENQLTKVTGYP